MKTQVYVLLHSVVVGRGLPVLCEKYHAHCLAEVVELQAGATNAGHDRGVRDDLTLDAEFAGPEDQICVRSRSGDLSDPASANVHEGIYAYPKGSPTTRNAMSVLSASARISSLPLSTNSLSATITGRP